MTGPASALHALTDKSGELSDVHDACLQWFGEDYDLGALDVVLCAAAAEKLSGDPPWVLVVGGSGNCKTETVAPLRGAGAKVISTITGEAALLSGTPATSRAKNATGGLLREIGGDAGCGTLVIKDVTSILSMNRDTRAQVLGALRESYDGYWSRNVGTDGGFTLTWEGRLVVIGAVTTAWDRAYEVVSTMGDQFLLVRLQSDDGELRRRAGLQAMSNVSQEKTMRQHLSEATGKLLDSAARYLQTEPEPGLTKAQRQTLIDFADLVTRARTPVERDLQGNPSWAHALEMPTRFAKQLAQLVRGALVLGLSGEAGMQVAARACHDSMPPLRRQILNDVAGHSRSAPRGVAKRLQLPWSTVDRTLQELQLLGCLDAEDEPYGEQGRIRWLYSLAGDVSRDVLESSPDLSVSPCRRRSR